MCDRGLSKSIQRAIALVVVSRERLTSGLSFRQAPITTKEGTSMKARKVFKIKLIDSSSDCYLLISDLWYTCLFQKSYAHVKQG